MFGLGLKDSKSSKTDIRTADIHQKSVAFPRIIWRRIYGSAGYPADFRISGCLLIAFIKLPGTWGKLLFVSVPNNVQVWLMLWAGFSLSWNKPKQRQIREIRKNKYQISQKWLLPIQTVAIVILKSTSPGGNWMSSSFELQPEFAYCWKQYNRVRQGRKDTAYRGVTQGNSQKKWTHLGIWSWRAAGKHLQHL